MTRRHRDRPSSVRGAASTFVGHAAVVVVLHDALPDPAMLLAPVPDRTALDLSEADRR